MVRLGLLCLLSLSIITVFSEQPLSVRLQNNKNLGDSDELNITWRYIWTSFNADAMDLASAIIADGVSPKKQIENSIQLAAQGKYQESLYAVEPIFSAIRNNEDKMGIETSRRVTSKNERIMQVMIEPYTMQKSVFVNYWQHSQEVDEDVKRTKEEVSDASKQEQAAEDAAKTNMLLLLGESSNLQSRRKIEQLEAGIKLNFSAGYILGFIGLHPIYQEIKCTKDTGIIDTLKEVIDDVLHNKTIPFLTKMKLTADMTYITTICLNENKTMESVEVFEKRMVFLGQNIQHPQQLWKIMVDNFNKYEVYLAKKLGDVVDALAKPDWWMCGYHFGIYDAVIVFGDDGGLDPPLPKFLH